MNFLPYENITLVTMLTEREIYSKLNDFIEFDKSHRVGLYDTKSTKKYSGQIIENSFYIKRIINYKNSFLPRIEGTIISDIRGTKVNIKMRLYPLVLIFMIIWFTGLSIVTFIILSARDGNNNNIFPLIIPFIMILFGYLLFTIPFKIESRIAFKDINALFRKD